MNSIKNLGQIFTPEKIVLKMLSLIKNGETILEPSSGDGAFLKFLKQDYKNITSIEIDKNICPKDSLNMDFFDYNISNKHDTIIGNPPYVKSRNILSDINSKLGNKKANLYLYFIEKSIEHLTEKGEIIFITPRDFINLTSASKLNEIIYKNGTITHWLEFGEKIIFEGYSPSVVIWRFEKNNFHRKTLTNNGTKKFIFLNGKLMFTNDKIDGKRLGDFFMVKVGGVSGLDKVFTSDEGNMEFVCSYTNKTGKLKTMFYDVINEHIENNKNALLNRKVRKFDENNWWKWGRDFYKSDKKRIYVNTKTRNKNPFFINDCKNYDGSILALFPKTKEIENNLQYYCDILNNTNWESYGFKDGGRFIFNQRSLENIIIDF